MSQGLFRHLDGGYYRLLHLARCADTGAKLAVYEHRWPFDPSTWVRDRAAFFERFSPVSEAEFDTARAGDRAVAQHAVMDAKHRLRVKASQTRGVIT